MFKGLTRGDVLEFVEARDRRDTVRDTKILEAYIKETNSNYLDEFLKMIFIWEKFPEKIVASLESQYRKMLNTLRDPDLVCLSGSSVLIKMTQDQDPDFHSDCGDIDFFLNFSKTGSALHDHLKFIFSDDLLKTLGKDYFEYYISPVMDKKFSDVGLSRNSLHATSSQSAYHTMSDDSLDIETFQAHPGFFRLNFIQCGKPEGKRHRVDTPSRFYQYMDRFMNDSIWTVNFPRIKDPAPHFHILSLFDFENLKFVWDFKNQKIESIYTAYIDALERGAIKAKGYAERIKDDSSLNDSEKYTQFQRYEHFLDVSKDMQHVADRVKKSEDYENNLRVQSNPRDLRFSELIISRAKNITHDSKYLFLALENWLKEKDKMRADMDRDEFIQSELNTLTLQLPSKSSSTLRTNFLHETLRRVSKYNGRGFVFNDEYGVINSIINFGELETFLLKEISLLRMSQRKSILKKGEGAISSAQYSIAQLEQQRKSNTTTKNN